MDEKEPTGHSGLQIAEEVAGDSVDMPEGQGVQERADGEELRRSSGFINHTGIMI